MKTLTIRLPVELHERVERAASAMNIRSLNQFISEAAEQAAQRALGEIGELPPGEHLSLAILIDLDSFVGRPTINIDAIERLASTLGRPLVRQSFASGGMVDITASKGAVLARHYRHEDLPSRDALRLRLAIEAVNLVDGQGIRNVVVVTGDEEFGLVSDTLRRGGCTVIGVGMRPSRETSPNFIRTFDSFRFYDQLDRPPESDELAELRADYVDHLILAAFKLDRRGSKAVGAALIPLVKARHPEASPELLELRNWRDLAERAADMGLVERIEPSGGDFHVALTEKGRDRAAKLLEETEEVSAKDELVKHVSTAVAEILGIELPRPATRFLVFSVAQWVLKEETPAEGLSLVELSHQVAGSLGATGVPQNTVYRLLNGLYRGGAFEYAPNPENQHDPQVLRARLPGHQFDDVFVLNLLRILKLKRRVEADPKVLSQVIYGTQHREAKLAELAQLANAPDLDRAKLARRLDLLESGPD